MAAEGVVTEITLALADYKISSGLFEFYNTDILNAVLKDYPKALKKLK
ncbi:MAG: hypothetical protein K2X90_01415 [Candidatus Babeliaceae bacterium]|nr:hypothetical protein [Candidatus Babeliaceae bacterium]